MGVRAVSAELSQSFRATLAVERSRSGYSDDLFHIADYVTLLLADNWWIDREHVEPGADGNGSLTWVVTCSQDGKRIVAQGSSPFEAYRQAARLGGIGREHARD